MRDEEIVSLIWPYLFLVMAGCQRRNLSLFTNGEVIPAFVVGTGAKMPVAKYLTLHP